MRLSRRGFLAATGSALASAQVALRARDASARGALDSDSALERLVQQTLDAARKAGASYADVRVVRRLDESLSTREAHVTSAASSESYGLGVRVIAGGAWGFAATSRVLPVDAVAVATRAVAMARAASHAVERKVTLVPEPPHVGAWRTPLEVDPFKVGIDEKAAFLLALDAEALRVPGVKFCESSFHAVREWKLVASTDGAWVEQELTRVRPSFSATAIDATTGDFAEREHDIPALQAGWEHVTRSTLLADARRTGEEAVEKLRAPSVTPRRCDLILAPSNLWLTIHESVGHPTELDRALGYEANYAGTSFATVDKLGKLEYAAPAVTLFADKTTPGGLATCAWDDDGVATSRWNLVERGRFVGYQTTREQAGWIGEARSRGTSYAQDYKSFPFQRMPNVSLEPAPGDRGLKEIVAATDDGIVVVGRGSWSIDHQRHNFQFGGQLFYEVKRGKITRALRDVAYQSNSVEFWRSCDLIGGAREVELHGSFYDGKGEPGQVNAVSHGCPPARFRGVNILATDTRRGG